MANRKWTIAILTSVLFLASGCSSKATPQGGPEVAATPASPAATDVASSTASAGVKDVGVTIQEWSITPSSATAPAGAITFSVSNAGTIPHEFVVLSTDTLAAEFPIRSFEGEANRIDEDKVGKNVGETGDMQPASTKSLTLNLKPGHYAFVCNLPGHYGSGMHIDFTVT